MTNTGIIINNLINLVIALLIGWGLYYMFDYMDHYSSYVVGVMIAIAFFMGRDFGRKS